MDLTSSARLSLKSLRNMMRFLKEKLKLMNHNLEAKEKEKRGRGAGHKTIVFGSWNKEERFQLPS